MDGFPRTLLYLEIPSFFTWNSKSKKWCPRKQGQPQEDGRLKAETLGRIPTMTLNCRQAELYYLRMLLHHVRGATSFNDLKLCDSVVCETFEEACRKLDLLEDDTETDRVMEESASIRFGSELREVFRTILLYATPANPKNFWLKWETP